MIKTGKDAPDPRQGEPVSTRCEADHDFRLKTLGRRQK